MRWPSEVIACGPGKSSNAEPNTDPQTRQVSAAGTTPPKRACVYLCQLLIDLANRSIGLEGAGPAYRSPELFFEIEIANLRRPSGPRGGIVARPMNREKIKGHHIAWRRLGGSLCELVFETRLVGYANGFVIAISNRGVISSRVLERQRPD